MAQLTVADDEIELAELAAERLTRLIEVTIDGRGNAHVCLSGGSTPRRLYTRLADPARPWRDRIDWSHLHLFWSDERHVPSEHPESNYGMAKAALIDHVPIPGDHVHRIRGEMLDARDAADDYEHALDAVASAPTTSPVASAFLTAGASAEAVRRKNFFDLTLLGLGEDGHIASIFPGSELLEAVGRPFTGRRVAAVQAPHLNTWRITLTPNAILDSRAIVVLVAGERKAAAVHAALEEPLDVKTHPAQLLRIAEDRIEWLLDRAAASRLRM